MRNKPLPEEYPPKNRCDETEGRCERCCDCDGVAGTQCVRREPCDFETARYARQIDRGPSGRQSAKENERNRDEENTEDSRWCDRPGEREKETGSTSCVQTRAEGQRGHDRPTESGSRRAIRRRSSSSGKSVQTQLVEGPGDVSIVPLAVAVERMGHVDFAKIDCEGSEWEMFDETEPWQHVDELAIEYHERPGHNCDDALRRVCDLGFRPWQVSPGAGFGVILASR